MVEQGVAKRWCSTLTAPLKEEREEEGSAWLDGHGDVLKKKELGMVHGGHGAGDGGPAAAWVG